ncbi:hypothetical protein CN096_37345, partial [Sinorhizobium meliloti]
PLLIGSLALFIEHEPGAPMRVHSQHPLGKISARPRAKAGLSVGQRPGTDTLATPPVAVTASLPGRP